MGPWRRQSCACFLCSVLRRMEKGLWGELSALWLLISPLELARARSRTCSTGWKAINMVARCRHIGGHMTVRRCCARVERENPGSRALGSPRGGGALPRGIGDGGCIC